MPAPSLFDICVHSVGDVLFKAYSGDQVSISAAIKELQLPRTVKKDLVSFFTDVQLGEFFYSVSLVLREPLAVNLEKVKRQTKRPCTIGWRWPGTYVFLTDAETRLRFRFIEPHECTLIVVGMHAGMVPLSQVIDLLHSYEILPADTEISDYSCSSSMRVSKGGNPPTLAYKVAHRYEGPPEELPYMHELYRRAVLGKERNICIDDIPGPFGRNLTYRNHLSKVPRGVTMGGDPRLQFAIPALYIDSDYENDETDDETDSSEDSLCSFSDELHFIMGGERFDTTQPEAYLFGENSDLNFLGNRPLPFPYPAPQPNEPTKTLKSLVNIRKDSLRLVRIDDPEPEEEGEEEDEEKETSPKYNVEFTFDTDVKVGITIHYFATEEIINGLAVYTSNDPTLTSETVHYKRGASQTFSLPSHVLDPGMWNMDDFSYDADKQVIPMVIQCCVEEEEEHAENLGHAHMLFATFEKNSEDFFSVKPLKQKQMHQEDDIDDSGSECVICMSDIRDTLILPCRHLCLCNGCADSLRYQASNCPICRQPFRALLQMRAMRKKTSLTPAVTPQSEADEVQVIQENIPPGYEVIPVIEALNGPSSSCTTPPPPVSGTNEGETLIAEPLVVTMPPSPQGSKPQDSVTCRPKSKSKRKRSGGSSLRGTAALEGMSRQQQAPESKLVAPPCDKSDRSDASSVGTGPYVTTPDDSESAMSPSIVSSVPPSEVDISERSSLGGEVTTPETPAVGSAQVSSIGTPGITPSCTVDGDLSQQDPESLYLLNPTRHRDAFFLSRVDFEGPAIRVPPIGVMRDAEAMDIPASDKTSMDNGCVELSLPGTPLSSDSSRSGNSGEGDVKGTAGHSRGRVVRRAARLYRRARRAASEETAAGASKVRRKRQKRKVEELEDDSRPQPKRKAPENPPPRTYFDPRLSRVAPIYHDVVAGESVLVNYIADDPCPWESTNSVELSACERGVTPTDLSCPYYRQYQDFHTRKVLSLVASELTMWLDNQESDRL
uniref:RING-type E3 ubiquitin transferase n=1 Tax=Branchiostoma floridae TaxID=7739 RepID=C3Y9B4_BRAFL|eukprot:XP_002607160.1 hypothetical protein BRAFLDRAFT_118649 [Branchiostoma floridae]